MKKIIARLICCLIPAAVLAATDYLSLYSEDAAAAARAVEIPATLKLSNEEKAIYRLGFAHGYDTALDSATRTINISTEPTYIVNTASGKFHKPECYMVNAILLENRKDLFGSYEDAIEAGYSPCGKCLK